MESSIPTIHFQVQTVSFREGMFINFISIQAQNPSAKWNLPAKYIPPSSFGSLGCLDSGKYTDKRTDSWAITSHRLHCVLMVVWNLAFPNNRKGMSQQKCKPVKGVQPIYPSLPFIPTQVWSFGSVLGVQSYLQTQGVWMPKISKIV